MSTEKKLQSINQSLIQKEAESGIGDLLGGVSVFLLGLLVGFDLTAALFLFVFIVIAAKSINQKFVYPRTGYAGGVSLDHVRVSYSFVIYILGVLILLSALGMMKYIDKPLPSFLDHYFLGMIGLFIASVYFIIAKSLGIKRIYFYGFLILILTVTGNLLGLASSALVVDPARYLGINILVFGLISTAIGVSLMIRFAKKYPVIEDSADDTKED